MPTNQQSRYPCVDECLDNLLLLEGQNVDPICILELLHQQVEDDSKQEKELEFLRPYPDEYPPDEALFIITLDFELAWGLPTGSMYQSKILEKSFDDTRAPTRFLLRASEEYGIPYTWATVGHLFLDSCERQEGVPHKGMPRPTLDWYSHDPCTDLSRNPHFYARDLIEEILSSPVDHEIGYHSFSHVTFSQCSRDIARAEIGISRDLAKEFGIEFKSFVFPRNEVGHVDLLKEFGFRVYRGAGDWRWNMSQRLLTRRINAAKDWALPLLTTPTYQGGIWEVPTHFHFTSLLPWDGKLPVISLLGVCRGIRKAVRERRVFTVYFHPWELLLCPSHGKGFQTLLRYASKMRDKGKLSIITMGELPTILDRRI